MFPSLKPSQRLTLTGVVNPQSAAAGTVTTAWVSVAQGQWFMALVAAGVLGASATLNAKLEQAQDGSGTGAKDIVGKAITAMVKATDDNKQAIINVKQDDLDANGNFTHVRLSMTIGAAASLVFGALFEVDPRYGPADLDAAASVKEIVG